MDDKELVELYWERDERAITETEQRFGSYCRAIAYRIIGTEEDAEECVSDVLLRAWNTIPPQKPERLDTFLGKITRNLAIDYKRKSNAVKRGSGEYDLAYQELERCLQSGNDPAEQIEAQELVAFIEEFLLSLPTTERRVFLRRYWHFQSIAEISAQLSFSEAKTRTMLYRTRKKLRTYLKNRGVIL